VALDVQSKLLATFGLLCLVLQGLSHLGMSLHLLSDETFSYVYELSVVEQSFI
jgi:hypothetical protein